MKTLTSAHPNRPLQIAVQEMVNELAAEYSGGAIEFVTTLSDKKMDSGMVTTMNDCSETLAFYEKFKGEINGMLSVRCQSIRVAIFSVGGQYDSGDPLCLMDSNQHNLARYAFYITTRFLFDKQLETI